MLAFPPDNSDQQWGLVGSAGYDFNYPGCDLKLFGWKPVNQGMV
jgi:hypothetical protein